MVSRTQLRARCPECDTMVSVSAEAGLGDVVTCPECQLVLEVVNLRPLELDYADDEYSDYVDEDYNYDDDDDYEDDDDRF